MIESLEDKISKIEKWGIARNITEEGGATPRSQMQKCQEELLEFFEAHSEWIVFTNHFDSGYRDYACYVEDAHISMQDALGDMLVCMIQAIRLLDITMEDCLDTAWIGIRHRKGKMIAGKFVKETEEK